MAAKRARTSARMAGARMTDPGTRGGFTIIEVVLVLAIAGLIFLMVFIALPALQRSQRDTQRRNDLGRVTNAITQYQTNNNGRLPADGICDSVQEVEKDGVIKVPFSEQTSTACSLIRTYLNSVKADSNEFVDPDGPSYGMEIVSFDNMKAYPDYSDYKILLVKNAFCNGEVVEKASNTRSYAVRYQLEGSGVYCQDNGGGAAGATTPTNP